MTIKDGATSQFLGGGYGASNFLGDSLKVMTADTRKGLGQDVTQRLEQMGNYVSANPTTTNATRFNAYKDKVMSSSGKPHYTQTVSPKF